MANNNMANNNMDNNNMDNNKGNNMDKVFCFYIFTPKN